jgi:hypothetical protein
MSFLDRECIADKLVVTQKRENLPVFDKRTVEEIERDAHIAATNIKNCLHAVLTWEISTRNALCQTNLCSISFVPEAPWMGTSDPKCPLRFAMESPSTLEHDFSHGYAHLYFLFCPIYHSNRSFNQTEGSAQRQSLFVASILHHLHR